MKTKYLLLLALILVGASLGPSPTISAPPTPAGPGLDAEDVLIFPAPLFVGDRVSVDVVPRLGAGVAVNDAYSVTLTYPDGSTDSAPVAPQGLDYRPRARFYWTWTASGPARATALTVTLNLPPEAEVGDPNPTDNRVVVPLTLHPQSEIPPPEPSARWTTTETAGFRLHYLTNAAAERDLAYLTTQAAWAYDAVTARLAPGDETLDIYLMDRIIGHGGYASSAWVAVAYADRQYVPQHMDLVLRHELTHRLDAAIDCDGAPTLLREGLAVYITGGHYRLDAVPRKTATLVRSGRYIPLATLAQDFYLHQHEIGYLEAGALVTYVVDQFGWESVATLCHAAKASEAGDDVARLEAGLRELSGLDLAEFERRWKWWLHALPSTARDSAALDAKLHLMEAIRGYQAAYDPTAHFLIGILFSPEAAEQRGLTADFARRPRAAEPIAVELLLEMAVAAWERHQPVRAETLLAEVDLVLTEGVGASALASDVRAMTEASLARGYEPYRLVPNEDGSYLIYALEYADWPRQRILVGALSGDEWLVTGPQPDF
ncbi:MAG: hypothetical protein ACLFTI_05160 [Anaerolineales bacterium]